MRNIKYHVSEFLQLIEDIFVFYFFWLVELWNVGIVEYWNVDFNSKLLIY